MFQTTNQIKSTLFGGQLFVPQKFKGEQPTHLDVHCWLARNTIVTLGKEILASEVILSNMNKYESRNQHIEIYYTNLTLILHSADCMPCTSHVGELSITSGAGMRLNGLPCWGQDEHGMSPWGNTSAAVRRTPADEFRSCTTQIYPWYPLVN